MPKLTDLETTIKRMLAQADRAGTPEEAAAFSEHAERLMLRHGIDRATLEAKGEAPAEDIGSALIIVQSRYYKPLAHLVFRIAEPFGCRAVQWQYPSMNESQVEVIGYTSDLARVRELYDHLRPQAERAMGEWWKRKLAAIHHEESINYRFEAPSEHERFVARRSFMFGFAGTVGARLEANRTRVAAEVDRETGTTGAELVLLDRDAMVVSEFERRHPDVKAPRKLSHLAHARRAGQTAGAQANLGERAVGGGRQAIGNGA